MKLTDIKINPNNPRIIKDEKYKKLVESLRTFPKMLALRPIIVDNDNVILGGNMRYKALQELKYKNIPDEWVKRADDLTEDEKKEFLIKDNVGFGEWDYDILANEWEVDKLEEWGVDLPNFDVQEIDYSDKNKEVDTDFLDQKYNFKLEYSEEEYLLLKEKIQELGKTPEQIFYDALIPV